MAIVKPENKGGRPKNPVNEGDLKKYLKDCAKVDIPKLRKRLMDIALGVIKEDRFDIKTGAIVKINIPLSVSVDAINAYGKNVLSKIEADAKADNNIKVEYSVTDALKTVEEKKRAEYEKRLQKEIEAKNSNIVPMRKVS